nr:hypothetical protein [Tanacetum cinerariifolium]
DEMAQMERERAEVKRKRRQDVLDSAMYFSESDWLNIWAQVEANASLSKTLLEFEKICKVQSNSQIQAFSRTLKRSGPVLEEASSKRQQSTEALSPSVPEVPHSPAVSSPLFSHTRRKSLGRKHIHKGSCVWKHQNLWEIRSWRLYTLSNVLVLETVSGEIDSDVVGNDITTVEQLIQFISNQLAAAKASFV